MRISNWQLPPSPHCGFNAFTNHCVLYRIWPRISQAVWIRARVHLWQRMSVDFTLLHSFVMPAHAHRWPGKTVKVLLNNRNKTRNLVVVNADGTPHAWPKYMDGWVEDVLEQAQ